MPGPPQRGDRQHRVDQIGRQHRRDRERHDQRRDRERDVGQPHDDGFDPAAEIAGDEPEDRRRAGTATTKDADRQQQRHAVAEQDAGEDVAADIVGAEPILGWTAADGGRGN